jgi:XTP/dITP diphosphohydrolase
MKIMKLLIATRNSHKLHEIKTLFQVKNLDIISAFDYPDIPEVEEDRDTFEGNAVKKAATMALATGHWALADDSGLEVDALDGQPGVYSARFAGEPVDYHANNIKLLRLLENEENRTARFRCVIGLSSPRGSARTVEGRVEGAIARELRGHAGFGYDPLFIPADHEQTFAEMGVKRKNTISHRGNALKKAREAWKDLMAASPNDWL